MRICMRKRKMGNAALASSIKKRALLAESRQCAVSENPPAAIYTSTTRLIFLVYRELARFQEKI